MENKTDITVYSNNKKEKRGMVLRTEKPQALYVALEKKRQSFQQTNKQEKGGKNDAKQNKHQKLQNAGSAQSIRAQNKTIMWDGETKVKKRKKERKKKKRSRTLTAAAAAALKSNPIPLRSFSAHDDERSSKNQSCNKQTNNQQTKKKKKTQQQQQQRKPRFAEKPHLQSSLLTPVCHYYYH
jgi:hypothetical protein